MKRKHFISAMVTIAAAPLASYPQNKNKMERSKGFKATAGEGRIHGHIQLKGVNSNVIDIKISGKDTNGDLLVFEQTSLSQGKGTPLHIHPLQDEIFYVLEGQYYFQVGEEKYHLAAGDSIFLPREVPHAWTQVSATGKMSVVLQPAGKLENFFITMAALASPPSKGELEKIFADNEMQVVGPTLKIE